jgi:diguanylate cyclase (GGDEF)-like protein
MRGQGAGATREDQDPVTGLLNRRSLPLIVQRELYRAGRGGISPVAMLFVMLRDFKDINQMHGHQVGDLLLENTGIRIRETVRKSDYTFRWEGTNIVVLLPELATRLDGLVVAEKIHSAVTVPYRFRGLDLAPGCHIGIALYPDDAADADELFNRANSAVIEAEKRGEACLYFDRETHQRASDRLTLKTALQRAFEGNELELFYQPIVHRDGSIAGAEALMRWNHPTRGLIGPAEFIEVAEDSRLIAPIDKLALYTVCRKLVALKNHPELFLTLNVSAINLSDASLPQVVSQAIKHTGLTDPSRLVLEITESRAAKNRSRFLTVIEEIQDMGVKIWIDDFGTGESSLSYLKHLPISTVKIDKDFVAELETDAADMEYLSGIISTVRSRRKSIVIEGVATLEQAGMLRNLAVEYLQGFYFARPVPAGELDRMLSAGTGLPMD